MHIREGGCLCRAVRYRVTSEPQAVAICHCSHCQKASGSAFSVNLVVRAEDYEQHGETRYFLDTGDSGMPSFRHFCAQCGSPVVTKATNLPDMLLVKAGTLDDPSGLWPDLEIYVDHAAPWHAPTEGARRFPQAPTA
jgi:hypothetical protein